MTLIFFPGKSNVEPSIAGVISRGSVTSAMGTVLSMKTVLVTASTGSEHSKGTALLPTLLPPTSGIAYTQLTRNKSLATKTV